MTIYKSIKDYKIIKNSKISSKKNASHLHPKVSGLQENKQTIKSKVKKEELMNSSTFGKTIWKYTAG